MNEVVGVTSNDRLTPSPPPCDSGTFINVGSRGVVRSGTDDEDDDEGDDEDDEDGT